MWDGKTRTISSNWSNRRSLRRASRTRFLAGDISTDKAQKMIAKAIEVQRKVDADRSATRGGDSPHIGVRSYPSILTLSRGVNRFDCFSTRELIPVDGKRVPTGKEMYTLKKTSLTLIFSQQKSIHL